MQRATHLPERPAEVPRNWHVRVHLRNVCRVGDLCNNTFNDANVAVEGSIESPAGLNYGVNKGTSDFKDRYVPKSSTPVSR